VLTVPSAEIDRGRGLVTFPAPQPGQHMGEYPTAVVADEQAHRQDRLAPAAMQFEPAVGPVREAVAEAGNGLGTIDSLDSGNFRVACRQYPGVAFACAVKESLQADYANLAWC
jgi:hypothetical protein